MEKNDLITLDPTVNNPTPPIISLDEAVQQNRPPDPDIADKRAEKAYYGLQDNIDKPKDEYYDQIINGREGTLRHEVAAALDSQRSMQAYQNVVNYASQRQSPMTTDDANVIMGMTQPKQENPDSVFESGFAKMYTETMFKNVPYLSPWLNDAIAQAPQAVQQVNELSQELVSKYAYLRKWQEDLQQQVSQQSWPGYIADVAKQMIPFYSSLKTRGTIPGTYFSGGLLGSEQEAQGQALFSLPFDEMVKQFPGYINKIKQDNPQLALQLVTNMIGSSTSDQNLSNTMEAIDLASVVAPAVKRPLLAGLRKAGVDLVRSVPSVEELPTTTVAAGATGDMETSATTKFAAQIGRGIRDKPTPVQDAIEALTSNYKLDKVDVTNNPGRYGQEIVNRLNEIIDTGQHNITEALLDAYRVNRTPELAEEAFSKDLYQKIKDNYKGIDNQLLDVTDPIYFEPSNTYYREYHLGDADGSLFKDYSTARENARKNGLVLKESEVEKRIGELEEELKVTPQMDADVNELNRYDRMEKELAQLKARKSGSTEDVYKLAGAINTTAQKAKKAIEAGDFDLNERLQDQLAILSEERRGFSLRKGEGYEIKQQGLGYYINYTKFEDETSDPIRDGRVKLNPEGNRLPPSWFGNWVNATVGWIRTPDEVLSRWENEQRKIATHGPGRMLELAKNVVQPIEKMPRKYWKDFDRFIHYGQKKIDPDSPDGAPGYWFKSPGEVENWYLSNIGRLPDKTELAGYWAYKSANEFDRILREVFEHRNKARLGAAQFRITIPVGDGSRLKSRFFDGISHNELPGGADDQIAIMGDGVGQHKIYLSQFVPPKLRKELEEQIKSGTRRVVEIYNPDLKPLDGFADIKSNHIRYIVTDSAEEKPLSFNGVPRRGGGHLVPEYDHYIKQPIIDTQKIGSTKNIYKGDMTLAAARNHAEGSQWAENMNKIREFIRDKKIPDAMSHARKTMDVDWDKIYSEFQPTHRPDGTEVPPRINPNYPIYVVPKGKTIVDIDKSLETMANFRDGTRSGNRARMAQVEFTQQRDSRDLYVVRNKGTIDNPLFSHEPADLMDPITIMNRALGRVVNSMYMDDYKIFAAEHFITQARKYLKASDEELKAAPFYQLFKQGGPDWKPLTGQNLGQLWHLKGNWKKVRDFIGVPSVADNFVRAASEKLIDSIYKGAGPKAANMADYLIPQQTDPLAVVRKYTYHAKMGLFSIPQFFTQASTFTNVFALSPRHAPAGALGMLLHGWSEMNASENILKTLDEYATKLELPGSAKFKPGEWLEARRELINSGFNQIGGENVFLDTPWSTKLIQNGKDQFLSWGELPFKLGAKSIRTSSWYTSYLEWRAKNPTKAITRADREQMLNRATLLDHNQSRASSSLVHTGIMAVPFQFQAYALRLMEMFTGHRLTVPEKARLFGVSAIMYGIPIGGLGLLGYPLGDYIRQKLRQGEYPVPGTNIPMPAGAAYIPGEHPLYTLGMEGLPAEIMKVITGEQLNVSKFGAKGLDPLDTLTDSDKTMWDIFGGASWATAKNLWTASSPWRWWATSVINGDQEQFPLTLEDVMDAAKEITSLNHAHQAYVGVTTGHWISKNDNYLKDTSAANAILMGVTGLSPVEVQDAYYDQKAIKNREAMNNDILKLYLKAFHRGIESYEDPQLSKKFFTQAAALMAHYPDERKAQAMQMAYDQNKQYIDRVKWNLFMSNVDPTRRQQMMDIYTRIQQLKVQH